MLAPWDVPEGAEIARARRVIFEKKGIDIRARRPSRRRNRSRPSEPFAAIVAAAQMYTERAAGGPAFSAALITPT